MKSNETKNGEGFKMNIIEKIYPGSKVVGIDQIFIIGRGWVDTEITNEVDAADMIRASRGSVFALILKDPVGFHRVADFKRKELEGYLATAPIKISRGVHRGQSEFI